MFNNLLEVVRGSLSFLKGSFLCMRWFISYHIIYFFKKYLYLEYRRLLRDLRKVAKTLIMAPVRLA